MEERKENMPLLIIAGILTVLVIACIIAVICMNVVSSDKDKTANVNEQTTKIENTISTSNTVSNDKNNDDKMDTYENEVQDKDKTIKEEKNEEEDNTLEEVKKINESEKMIYERVIDGKKIPTINLTTKYATKVNEEVEKKYKENTSGQYIVYSYCMYIETATLILDNVSGSSHNYDVYNINTATGKRLTNEEILQKVKMSKEDFDKKVKKAYQDKFEEVYKDQKSNSNYKTALEKTLKNAEEAYEKSMYIDPYGVVCCMAKLISPVDKSENEYEVELK